MSQPITKVIKGPAVVEFAQASYFSQDDVVVNMSPALFDVNSSAFGSIGQRIDDFQASVQFIPMGRPDADMLAIFNKVATKPLNAFMADMVSVSAVNATDDELTSASHGLADGTPARIFSIGGAVPAGSDEDTLYYTHAIDANTLTLHDSQAEGISGANAVDLTDAGSGKLRLIEQQPLRIQSLVDGEYIEFANACVSQLPNLRLAAASQIFSSALGFRMFPKFGVARATAGSVYSTGSAAITASLDPDTVITQPYAAAWGASAPWDDFEFEEGAEVSFQLALNDNRTDSQGTGMVSLQSLTVSVSGKPVGPSDDDVAAAMKLQGAGAVRGASLGGDDLDLSGTGLYFRLYNAHLQQGSLVYGSVNQRLGDASWQAGRTVTAGVADPLFYIGTVAPS